MFAGCTVSYLRLKRSAIRNYLAIPFEHTKLERLTKVTFQQERDGAVNLL